MPFGPTENEALLLFQIPLLVLFMLLIWLVVGRRDLMTLFKATVAFFLYLMLGLGSLQGILGAWMLTLSVWAAVICLAIALFSSTQRSPDRTERPWRPY